ncbi:MAG TPA: recombinase family protein [Ktedonobacteraceae bacterium]|jgi:site-specific DNA recombinase|nr:recombinase family protein [Ktedonobacteraceae bacterium]
MKKGSARTEKSKPQPREPSVAAYIRVSTEDQAESGLGMDAQRTRCKALCEVKEWPSPTFYVDDGISGTKPISKRPGLRKLVEDVQEGNIDVVVIASLDRLGRRLVIVVNLIEELCFHNEIILASCKESFDTSTPQGTFVMHMFVAMAQLERDLISQRTSEALSERDKRDGEHGGGVPFGYKRTPNGIAIDEEAAKIVKRIFALHKRGKSLRVIGENVNKPHTSVASILKNKEIYKGATRGESDVRWPVILRG